MGTDQAAREAKQCRYCYEPMDIRATVCPHCPRVVFRAMFRSELRVAVLKLLLLVFLGLTFSFWFDRYVGACTWVGKIVGKQLADGFEKALPAQSAFKAQPGHQAKPKAH